MSRRSAGFSPRRRFAAALLIAGMLGACAIGPKFDPPKTTLPTAWTNTLPGAAATWPAPDWWHAFGSAQLDDLIEQARGGNTDLAGATARLHQAEAQAEVAGAPLFPSVQAETRVGPSRQLNLIGRERHNTIERGVLNASYEIDFWGKNRSALESAQASADAARFARDVVWLTTSTGVANLYFQFLSLQDRLKVAGNNLARARNALHDVAMEEHQGIVPHLATVQQQAVVAGLETVIPPLQQQLAASRSALAILTGRLPEDVQLRSGSLHDLRQPAVSSGLPSQLLERRPDVQQAEASLIAANADIRVARAQFLPSFSFNLSGGLESLTLAQGTVPPLFAYSLLSSVTQPIFNGGSLRGQLDQKKARYQELLAGNYRNTVISAFGDVEVALATLKAATAERAAQERSVRAARQLSGLANQSFRGGATTILDLLGSETAIYTAEDALVQAQLAYLQALVGLTKAIGGGWKL